MSVFFYICDYLGVTASEFFDLDSKDPVREKQLLQAARGLTSEQLENLVALIKGLKK